MLEGLAPKRREGLCPLVSNATDQLDDNDLQIFLSALADKMWSNNGLAEALTERGFKASETQIRRHRVKKCGCAS